MKTIKKTVTFLIITLLFSFFTCKSKSAATNINSVTAENYRIVIAFISKGAGIDYKSLEAVTKLIADQTKKTQVETFRWGREGELDLCLKLLELSTKEQKNLILEIKNIVGNADLVRISENSPCVHKK